jgi:hypothetical protein
VCAASPLTLAQLPPLLLLVLELLLLLLFCLESSGAQTGTPSVAAGSCK